MLAPWKSNVSSLSAWQLAITSDRRSLANTTPIVGCRFLTTPKILCVANIRLVSADGSWCGGRRSAGVQG